MPRNNGFWNWVVLAVTVGGYVPLVIGGLHHHSEINLAAYSLWSIAMAMAFGSAFYMKYDTWRLALGFFIGNVTMIVLGLSVGGYTFNHHINTLPLLASLSHAGLMSPTIIAINAMKDKNPKAALMVFSFLILLRPFEKARCASNTIDAATAMEVHSLRAAQFYCRIVPD
jgi:hypothetical protein